MTEQASLEAEFERMHWTPEQTARSWTTWNAIRSTVPKSGMPTPPTRIVVCQGCGKAHAMLLLYACTSIICGCGTRSPIVEVLPPLSPPA